MPQPTKTNYDAMETTSIHKAYVALSNVSLFIAVAILGFSFAMVLNSAQAMGAHSASEFVRKAALGNEFEIESSKIALQKSQDDNIRNFAQQMIDDHSKAADDLTAATSNADMATPNTRLDRKHQAMLDRLNSKSGADFDRLYIRTQFKAHDEAVDLFKNYSKQGDNQVIQNFASNTLPTLEEHKKDIVQLKANY